MDLGVTRRGGSPEATSAPTRLARPDLAVSCARERTPSARVPGVASSLAPRRDDQRGLLGSSRASTASTLTSPKTAAPSPSTSSKPPATSEHARPRASSLPCRPGSPETEPSTSGHRSSVSKARDRYFWRPPRRGIAKGGTSVDHRQVPEAKPTHFRKLARAKKPEGDTYRTPDGFQKHLPGTFRTPEGFPKPKADTFCNPRGCKKYLPRAFQTSDSLTKPDADVSASSSATVLVNPAIACFDAL